MEQLMQNTIQPVLTALITAIIAALGGVLIAWVRKKTGLQLSEAFQNAAQQAATQAVLAVEEKAAAAAVAGAEKWTSQTKYKTAIDLILAQVPAVTPEQADTLVHAALARIPALGSSGDMNKAPQAA